MKILNVKGLSDGLRTAIEELKQEIPFEISKDGARIELQKGDRFYVKYEKNLLSIEYTEKHQIFVGLRYFLTTDGAFEKQISPKMERLYVMLDCSRNAVLLPEKVKQFIRLIALVGYNKLMLYTEDTYEIDEEPYFGYLRGRYTKEELKEFNGYAKSFGIELIPCIQTLAHLNGPTRWQSVYGDVTDCQDILLVEEEKTYRLIERMFKSVHDCFSSKIINVGMDEAFLLGAGKYQEKYGAENRFSVFYKHLLKVADLAKKYGYEIALWSDAFLKLLPMIGEGENAFSDLPENVKLIYWDYYSSKKEHYSELLEKHKRLQRDVWFAGSSYTSYRFSADLTTANKTMLPAFDACVEKGVKDFIVTQWGDDGGECSHFSALPALCKIAARNFEESEEEYEKGVLLTGGYTVEDFSALHFPRDRYLFYNDCLTGIYDGTVDPDYAERYQDYEKKIENVLQKGEGKFAYLFSARKAYCQIMFLKYALGVETRAAYRNGNKQELKRLLEEKFKPLQKRIAEFYDLFQRQWTAENKIFGLEVHQIRLGGLIFRIEKSAERIEEYLNGKTESLPELEVDILDVQGNGNVCSRERLNGNVAYKHAVTVNNI